MQAHLVGVQKQEGNHEREETSGLSEGETQNSVREELACARDKSSAKRLVAQANLQTRILTAERRVARNTGDQATEDGSDTDTSTGQTDGSQTSTLSFSSGNDGRSHSLSDDAALLDGIARELRTNVAACVVHQQAVADGRLGLLADQRARDAGCGARNVVSGDFVEGSEMVF